MKKIIAASLLVAAASLAACSPSDSGANSAAASDLSLNSTDIPAEGNAGAFDGEFGNGATGLDNAVDLDNEAAPIGNAAGAPGNGL
ncbi:hypothetical protein [Sphingomonas mollis]|uniref:Circumsporozoite protein n=1 Tax=Sphingomonas mollis TaxID=2795726 RepID=A0ABS0XS12_9SPHN|nr:hypothetical protein [Sphingomonas sp. BT553]MBJ6122829.1 hypothetical protein [Sphingomonas sp. BT553]